jgi:Flp pilus assembly protein TadB
MQTPLTTNPAMNDQATMKQPHSFNFSTSSNKPTGFLGKIVAFVLSVGLFALAFMFSLAALAVVAVVGIAFAGWFWWKTRALRRQMREQGVVFETSESPRGGQVIEGEVIREYRDSEPSGKPLP